MLIAHFFTTINISMLVKALKYLINPFSWRYLRKGISIKHLEDRFLKYLGLPSSKIISHYNGRSAIYNGLKLLGIGEGDEVIIQAYTCISVPNPILQAGATPVYCDIDGSLNIDPKLLDNLITKKTKAIFVQHTFGNPAEIKAILDICKRNEIFLIEDCAHSLGSEVDGKKTGSFGDISIFSLGRDKVISSANGGMLLVNNNSLYGKIESVKSSLKSLPLGLKKMI